MLSALYNNFRDDILKYIRNHNFVYQTSNLIIKSPYSYNHMIFKTMQKYRLTEQIIISV